MTIKGSLLLSAPIFQHSQAKKLQCVFGQNLTVLGDKYGFNIKFAMLILTVSRHLLRWSDKSIMLSRQWGGHPAPGGVLGRICKQQQNQQCQLPNSVPQ